MSRELKTMCEDESSSMNKCLVFFAVLAVMGTVSRLGLLNAREYTHSLQSSESFQADSGKPEASAARVGGAIPAPKDGFAMPMTQPREIPDPDFSTAAVASSFRETRPVEIPGAFVPEEVEWQEVAVESEMPSASSEAEANLWEDPYGGRWHDQSGG